MSTTPFYLFSFDKFKKRVNLIKSAFGDEIPLCYSIKANPFLLKELPEALSHVEVCSPGELSICENLKIAPEKVLYSGVMKESTDIKRAIDYGVDILTAESIRHVILEEEAASKSGKTVKVLLRLTSGNQFGMSTDDIRSIIGNKDKYPHIDFIGLHYYSGTQKKTAAIENDMNLIDEVLKGLKSDFGFEPKTVEYGPGLGADYFNPPYEEREENALKELVDLLKDFAEKYPLALEFGRFIAAPCGYFVTEIKDIKSNNDMNFIICDGGIHHLKYHGQTMGMQIPPLACIKGEKGLDIAKIDNISFPDISAEETADYSICGSLCTVADVLIRKVRLPKAEIGDKLIFARCGAYSVTEGTMLFLSRCMPKIYYKNSFGDIEVLRDFFFSDTLNTPK
ncbi:MAG TPA: diaminopimelate decarboxylase [Ruminococcaceae bacterium]|nr:diaminopimelate decarboxylase [Oscillospiraceae bacterium]